MVFQPVPDCVEVDINMTLDGQLCQNTLYGFKEDGILLPADLNALASAVELWWVGNYGPLVSDACVLRDVEVKGLDSQSAFYAILNSGTPGSNSSPALPNHNTWCVKFTTGLIGRSQRGRNFIVGLTEIQVSANVLSQAIADQFVAAYGLLSAAFVSANFIWVIVSRQSGGSVRPEGVAFPVTGVSYEDLYVDSQRRRLPGRGR